MNFGDLPPVGCEIHQAIIGASNHIMRTGPAPTRAMGCATDKNAAIPQEAIVHAHILS